jgi:hypothetical protein
VPSEIKAVKLLGGEVILGKVTSSTLSNSISIEEAQLCVVMVDDGKMEVNLAPWLPYAREVRPNLETNYKIATGNK